MNFTTQQYADIRADILRVLSTAAKGRGPKPYGISAPQVLDRMEMPIFNLVTHDGLAIAGIGHGTHGMLAGSQVVQRFMTPLVTEGLVDFTQVDIKGASFVVKGKPIFPSYPVTTFYYLI